MITPTGVSESVMFSTLKISGDNGSGTGFLFVEQLADRSAYIFLVTNRHVATGLIEPYITLTTTDGTHENHRIDSEFTLHPNPDIDLAIVNVSGFYNTKRYRKLSGFTRAMIPSDEYLSKLAAIENVSMFGYPTGLSDEHNNLPVMRRGSTASHPAIDFNGKPRESLISEAIKDHRAHL